MSRFNIGRVIHRSEVQWDTDDYFVSRTGQINVGDESLVWIKLGSGSLANAQVAPLLLFKVSASGLEDMTHLLNASADFAVTRNILVRDIDGDGFEDLFLNNHGPELISGFPGEENAIYLYNETISSFDETILPWADFSHGSALGDFNHDGMMDILVNNLGSIENVPSYLLRQNDEGSFSRVDLPVSLVNDLGPLTTSIDLERDGRSEVVTVNQDGDLIIYEDVLGEATVISITELPITDSGVFEMLSADFDGNGRDDVVVLGTGGELQENGIVIGGTLKVLIIYDAGSESQSVLDVLDNVGLDFYVTGGQQASLVDLDNSSTPDISVTTFLDDWRQTRIDVFLYDDKDVEVVRHFDESTSINSIFVDATGDGVKDLLSIKNGQFQLNEGFLSHRFNNIAYDFHGSAGQTVKTLAAVMGADGLSNKEYVGIGLQLFDAGQSLASVCELALNAVGATTHSDVVNLLYTNLFGEAPTEEQAQEYVSALDAGVFTKGSLAAAAAELTDDLGVIDLVGLAETGIEYV